MEKMDNKPVNIRMPMELITWIEGMMPRKGKTFSAASISLLYELKDIMETKALIQNEDEEKIALAITENNYKWQNLLEGYFKNFESELVKKYNIEKSTTPNKPQ
jgi:hypothetical protein